MCGILALFGPGVSKTSCDLIEKQTGLMLHRGPDEQGIETVGDDCILAHSRLSIIGVSGIGGHQPIFNASKTRALVCNGEIYNHKELRERYLDKNTVFRTNSDNEVLLHLIDANLNMGDVLPTMHGMFAFVVSDGKSIIAARDPLGIKPLYFGYGRKSAAGKEDLDTSEQCVWISSELKPLMGVAARVEEFPNGHYFKMELGKGNGELFRYYDREWCLDRSTATVASEPKNESPIAKSPIAEEEKSDTITTKPSVTRRHVHAALVKSVTRRLMADVPVGCFLSGGLDSSFVCAVAARHVKELHTFTVGMEGSPDILAARAVAKHIGSIHHEELWTAEEAIKEMEKIMLAFENPDHTFLFSCVPNYFVARLAAQHVKVVLTGEGADEIFAGYKFFERAPNPVAVHGECVRQLAFMHDQILQRGDRMSMAHSLEARVPFLDTDLVDAVMALNPALKVIDLDKGKVEKHYFRSLLDEFDQDLLPKGIVWRKKCMFGDGADKKDTVRRAFFKACNDRVSDSQFAARISQFPTNTPTNKASTYYYGNAPPDWVRGEGLQYHDPADE